MGYFKDQQCKTASYLEKDEQKHCEKCKKQISDFESRLNDGKCKSCRIGRDYIKDNEPQLGGG